MSQNTRLLDHDPETGTTEWYHFDPTDGSFTIETVQDVTAIVESNLRMQNDQTGRYRDLNLVARFPLTVLMDLVQQGVLDTAFRIRDEKQFRRWLNDRDNMAWRCRLGRI